MRQIKYFILALTLLCTWSQACTIVNAYSGQEWAGSGFAVTVTAITSGNAVIVVYGSTTSVTVSDNGGSSPTYTTDHDTVTAVRDGLLFHWRRRSSITDGATSVTFGSISTNVPYAIYEVSGLGAKDASPAIATGAGTSPSVGFTAAGANECAFGAMSLDNGTTVTPPAGWTEQPPYADPVYDTYFAIDDTDLGAAGAKTLAPTLADARDWGVAVVSYLNAAGGGGGSALPKIIQQHEH